MSPTHAALEVGAVTGNPFAENIVPRFDDSDVSENDDEAEEEEALRSWKVAPQAIAGETQTEFFAFKAVRVFHKRNDIPGYVRQMRFGNGFRSFRAQRFGS